MFVNENERKRFASARIGAIECSALLRLYTLQAYLCLHIKCHRNLFEAQCHLLAVLWWAHGCVYATTTTGLLLQL